MADFDIENDVLVKYHGADESVVVPNGVVSIGPNAFEGAKSIQEVSLPEGLTNIGEMAFSDLENLRRVEFPSTLKTIGTVNNRIPDPPSGKPQRLSDPVFR